MTRTSFDALRSYAVAGAASLYCAIMLLAATGPGNGALAAMIA